MQLHLNLNRKHESPHSKGFYFCSIKWHREEAKQLLFGIDHRCHIRQEIFMRFRCTNFCDQLIKISKSFEIQQEMRSIPLSEDILSLTSLPIPLLMRDKCMNDMFILWSQEGSTVGIDTKITPFSFSNSSQPQQ